MRAVPSLLPKDLGATAKKLYRKSTERYGRQYVDLDDQLMPHAEEIVAAGLGKIGTSSDGSKKVLGCFPYEDDYTAAYGYGNTVIDIYHVPYPSMRMADASRLATLVGAKMIPDSGGPVPQFRVTVNHETATDFEHDSSKVFLSTIVNPTLVDAGYGITTLHATMVNLHRYPFGTDITKETDQDNPEPETCTSCEEHHPFAPYSPPEVEGFMEFVLVQITHRSELAV